MDKAPIVSVIVPAYNAKRTILETIVSVQQQTFSDFELIVINDGSTDNTLELLHGVKDERLRIFSYKNAGVSVARNRGISHANGEFIAFLDADDLWTPDKLELQLVALQQHPDAGVAYSWTYFMDEQGKSLSPCAPIFFEGNVYAELLVNNFIANGSNPLIRRQAVESVGEFDPGFPHCADWDFYLRLAARWHFVVVPKLQIFYRQSSGSMTSKIEGIEKQTLMMVDKTFRAAPTEFQSFKSRTLAWVYQYCTQQYLAHGTDFLSVNQASQKLWTAIRMHPAILREGYTRSLLKWLLKKWFLLYIARGGTNKSMV